MNSSKYVSPGFSPAILAGLLVVLGVYAIVTPQRAQQRAERLRAAIFDSHPGTSLLAVEPKQAFHVRLGELLAAAPMPAGGCPLEVQTSANPKETLARLRDGTATLGFALDALSEESGDLAALASLGRQYVHVIASADSKIETFRDLSGKRLGVGPEGYPGEALAKAIIGYYQFAAPPELVAGQGDDWEPAFRNGEIDALLLVEPLYGPEAEDLLATGWYRLVPIPEAPALERFWPGLLADAIPDAIYGPDRRLPDDRPGAVATVSTDTFLVAGPAAPAAAVGSALDRVFSMDRAAAHLAPISESQARDTKPLRLHPAAEAYYRRHDPPTRREVSRIYFFLLGWAALLCGAWGMARAGRRRRRAYRRRELETHLVRISECGQAIHAAQNPDRLAAALRDLSAAQRVLESGWREGKLETSDAACVYGACASHSLEALHKVLSPQWWDEPVRAEDGAPQTSLASRPSTKRLDYLDEEDASWDAVRGGDRVTLGEALPRSAPHQAEPPPRLEGVHQYEEPSSPPLPEKVPHGPAIPQSVPAPRKQSAREVSATEEDSDSDGDGQLQLFQ